VDTEASSLRLQHRYDWARVGWCGTILISDSRPTARHQLKLQLARPRTRGQCVVCLLPGLWRYQSACLVKAKIHYTRNPVSPSTGKLPTCYGWTCNGLVSDTANKSATSRCNGIWETWHNRHNGLLPAPAW